MNVISILLLVVIAALLVRAVIRMIKNKDKCSGCSGNCSTCSKRKI
ncbi:MAG: FeoB-associated Cys-rich membrane protein [Lachnospiraceae bacterium]|nr:FeoB-associated Cys-rich membrane protein [Lachnospiraceae bacterium]